MRLDWLKAFRAVMQTGTATGAASIILRTQPQVSRMIASLEACLGLELFEREGRRLIPTEQALQLLQHIEPLMLGFDGIENSAQDIREKRGRRLVVAAEPFLLHALVPEALQEVSRKSDARFAVDLCVRGLGLWMSRGNADLGVVALPFSQTDMTPVPFAEAEVVVAMPPQHPLAGHRTVGFADLVAERFIALRPSTLLRSHIDVAAARAGVSINPVIEASSGVAACEFVARGLGITIADPIVAGSFGASRILVKRMSAPLYLTYGFLTPNETKPVASVRSLMEAVEGAASRLGGSLVKNRRV
ncbi:MAG: LysR substrate-binding domain-containing protein [Burkholderiales bacterium]